MKDFILFARSWLRIENKYFRILAMLAAEGDFDGNLSDLCRYFSIDPQNKNRNQLRQALESLEEQGYISINKRGRKYHLSLIPKDEEHIELRKEWFEMIRTNPKSEGVSWEVVVKVALWLHENGHRVITNKEIAAALNVSDQTVSKAQIVLANEFSAIVKRNVSVKIGEEMFRRIGHTAELSAWLENV